MFLVSHSLDTRERGEVRSWIPKHPSVALVVAAVYFEWAICRAIIGLSKRPNKEVRRDLKRAHGLGAYKDIWRREIEQSPGAKTLPQAVKDWHGVTVAFAARNILVHGRDRYTQNMVRPRIDSILIGVRDICTYCASRGLDINKRLPQRRLKKTSQP
jgi:hypothetical protein